MKINKLFLIELLITCSLLAPSIVSATSTTQSQCPGGYDVIIVAGQSNNLTGRGKNPQLDTYEPNIFQYGRAENNNYKIIPAVEPLDHYNRPNITIGYIGTFTKEYLNNNLLNKGRCILILPGAKGGSTFSRNDWNPGDVISKDLVVRANHIMEDDKNRIIAFFWHQGEGDVSTMNKNEYKQAWNAMINYFNQSITGFSSSTHIFIGQMVPSWIESVGDPAIQIDNAHKELANNQPNIHFISATHPTELGLNDEVEVGFNNDLIHYSATSQRKLGQRYFNQYKNLVNTGKIIQLSPADYNADNSVNIFDYNILVAGYGIEYDIFDYNQLVTNYDK